MILRNSRKLTTFATSATNSSKVSAYEPSEMMNFNEMVSMLVEAMDTQASKIEEEKLKVCKTSLRLLERVIVWMERARPDEERRRSSRC